MIIYYHCTRIVTMSCYSIIFTKLPSLHPHEMIFIVVIILYCEKYLQEKKLNIWNEVFEKANNNFERNKK